jgi:Putative methionine and alanine importer, small subunit
MSGEAVVMLIIAIVLVWGGLLVSILALRRLPDDPDDPDEPTEAATGR